MFQNNAKLVKGVVYDGLNMDIMKEEMFNLIDDKIPVELANQIQTSKKMQKEYNLSVEEVRDYFITMDAISALTRYNKSTGVTHNLIIPKEVLSEGLVKELESVDLAKNLLDDYAYKFFNDHIEKDSVKPKDFCNGDEEKILRSVDMNKHISSDTKPKFILNGRKVNEDEFVKALENSPELAQMINTVLSMGF